MKHNIITEKVKKSAFRANNDTRIQSINSTKIYAQQTLKIKKLRN